MITDFLNQYSPKTITPSEAETLERPLSMEETSEALKPLNTGKSPGPDGLTVGYYKSSPDATLPYFLKAFNLMASASHTNKDLLKAHITMILKPGKYTNIVSNYRPISLLNIDVKLYAKKLANRILPLLPSLVSLDQVGFIPGREARDNTLKAISIHHWLSSSSKPGFFLSHDAEKVFARMAWDYMTEALKTLGFRDHMLQYVLALHLSPTARIKINGHLSDAFSISNGIRRGCPLSPESELTRTRG